MRGWGGGTILNVAGPQIGLRSVCRRPFPQVIWLTLRIRPDRGSCQGRRPPNGNSACDGGLYQESESGQHQHLGGDWR
jgi:hypothetical protein